jgi:hypothetical protein
MRMLILLSLASTYLGVNPPPPPNPSTPPSPSLYLDFCLKVPVYIERAYVAVSNSNVFNPSAFYFRRAGVCGSAGGPRGGRGGANRAGVSGGQQPLTYLLMDQKRPPLCGKLSE